MFYAEFRDGGHIAEHLHVIGDADKEHGTTIEFSPDFKIMEHLPFDHETIAVRLRRMAYLSKGLKMIFIDEQLQSKDE
jgi:DNA gyrase subunit B